MAKDPVCGMQVNEQDAVRSNNQNQTYYFCSDGCKQAFDKNPKQYAGQQPAERKTA